MLHKNRGANWSLLLVVSLFLALVLLASGGSAWVVSAQGTVAPPPPPPPPPAPPSGGPTSGSATTSTVGSGGLTVTLGTATAVFPASMSGFSVTVFPFNTNGYPTGNSGGGFVAPGASNELGLLVKDANGNVLHTLPAPGVTICFQVDANTWNQTPASQQAIQWWNGSSLVNLPTVVSPSPLPAGVAPANPGFLVVCTTVTQL